MRLRVAAIVVCGVAALLYVTSVWNGFAYDDPFIISLNERVHNLGRAHLLFTQRYWPNEELGLYRPLTMLTFAIDWAIGGGAPAWFHFINVMWHGAASVLVLVLLRSFVPAPAAFLGAVLFAVHPVHVEAVANVVGRADLMAATFSFAALVLWLRAPGGSITTRRMLAIAGCYLCALLSKESAIMLPALIALADAARGVLSRGQVYTWVRSNATALVLLACVALAFIALRTTILGSLAPHTVNATLDVTTSASDRLRTALQAWPHYIRLLLFPRTLLADYGPRVIMPAVTLTPQALLGAAILTALVAGGLIAWLRDRGQLALTLLFLPLALLPVSNLLVPIGILVAERTLYLPSFALAAAAAFAADVYWPRRTARYAMVAAAAVIVIGFAVRTVARIPDWRDSNTILAALHRDRPDAFAGVLHTARLAALHNDVPGALQRYAETLNTWPYRRQVVLEAATYAAAHGDLGFAQRASDFALTRWPDDLAATRLRAAVALDQADTATARTLIKQGLLLAPHDTLLRRMHAALHQPTDNN